MRIRVDRTKMAMPGEYYSYDVTVPVSEVDRSKFSYFIMRGNDEYVMFHEATLPEAISAMEKGWDRYTAYTAHEQASKAVMLELAQRVFPELKRLDRWPSPWVPMEGLDGEYGHDTRYTEMEVSVNA